MRPLRSQNSHTDAILNEQEFLLKGVKELVKTIAAVVVNNSIRGSFACSDVQLRHSISYPFSSLLFSMLLKNTIGGQFF